MDQITVCNVRGVAYSDNKAFYPLLVPIFGFTAHLLYGLVSVFSAAAFT